MKEDGSMVEFSVSAGELGEILQAIALQTGDEDVDRLVVKTASALGFLAGASGAIDLDEVLELIAYGARMGFEFSGRWSDVEAA